MKPYNTLSNNGKLRRLRYLASAALGRYDLKNSQFAFYAFETNLHYRVTTDAGERFLLRLASPGWRTFTDLYSEALWLDALRRDTSIAAPRVIPARSGELVLPCSAPGLPDIWHVTLMSWVPGRLLGHYLTEYNLEKMGALFARLHQHGAAWTPPAGFTTRRFEHWLSRGEENRILDNEQFPVRNSLLERMHQHVEQAYAALNRADLRVIHCDLWHNNIKLHRDELHPLDFEDTVWGFRAHDIAMSMLDLLEAVGEERYPPLLAAFRRGYQVHLAWPDEPIEPFQIGRLLWKINWVAGHQPQWLENMISRYTPAFELYDRTGRVVYPA